MSVAVTSGSHISFNLWSSLDHTIEWPYLTFVTFLGENVRMASHLTVTNKPLHLIIATAPKCYIWSPFVQCYPFLSPFLPGSGLARRS